MQLVHNDLDDDLDHNEQDDLNHRVNDEQNQQVNHLQLHQLDDRNDDKDQEEIEKNDHLEFSKMKR